MPNVAALRRQVDALGRIEHRLSLNQYLAASGFLEAGDAAQRRSLATPGRSEQRQLFTGHDFKADPAHRRHAAVIKFKAINRDMRGR